jgi:predicted unusual protein kinase regulating ubiquinone biosynthesis (AarF/ABC1/UbiB family)
VNDKKRSVREEMRRRMLALEAKLPTSSLARLGRTATTALRVRGLLGASARTGEVDVEALAATIASLGQLKGIAMKVGQILSYIDVALPEDVRAALGALQSASPQMPFERVVAILQEDLGTARADELLSRMDRTAVAAASIGQVHRATVPDRTPVAVKVRYPDIDRAIANDFGPAAFGVTLASLLYPGADIESFVREARERFLLECDYTQEAASQERFARIYASHPILRVPAVHGGYASGRVLTTTWMDGLDLDAYIATDPPRAERDAIGAALFELYVGTLFRHGLYNCDPHPGNYVFQTGGRVAILDYGCTRAFPAPFVAKLAALTRAVHADRRDDLHAAFVALGMVRDGQSYDFATARELVRSFFGPMLHDKTTAIAPDEAKTLTQVARSKRELLRLSLPGEFLFLLRIRYGVMSILARLGSRANWFRLEESFLATSVHAREGEGAMPASSQSAGR